MTDLHASLHLFTELIELVPRSGDDISLSIMNNMKEIEQLLGLQLSAQQTDPEFSDVCSYQRKRPADRKSQKYGQWAVEVTKKVSLQLMLKKKVVCV